MSKVVKRVATFLLALAMMFVLIPSDFAFAAEEERTSIYIQVPSDWENPCVWAWDADGNNAFDAWPGGEAEADKANEGWYYIWLPAWATHVIVNANEGTVQTGELVLDGKDTWITVKSAEDATFTTEKQTTGDTPAYVEKFIVHAKVDASWENPCLWAWSAPDGTNAFEAWPGKAMKAGEDGWYTIKVPVWVNSIIVNANDGAVQTEDITIDAAEVWVTVAADKTAEFSYEDPAKADVPNVKVHAYVPAEWEAPCLWAWSAPDGTNVYANWPGEALDAGENGWYEKEIPGWVNSVIINASAGSVQTTDLSVETGKDIWVVVKAADDATVFYEEPTVEAPAATSEPEASVETPAETPAPVQTPATASNVWIFVVVGVVLVAAIVVVVVVASKKKKN